MAQFTIPEEERMQLYRFKADDFTEEERDKQHEIFHGIYGDDMECGGCGWSQLYLYVLASSMEAARKMLLASEAGLCGECMCDLLVEMGYEIDS